MRRWWQKILLALGVMGPGLITAFADNDATGVATYSVAGARYGYSLLWVLFLITFSLAFIQEMSVRLGAVTGKGLADLIREEFGLRWTLFAMIVLLVANLTTAIANFAGAAAALEILGVSKFLSAPALAVVLWLLVVKGSYRFVERFFLVSAVFFFSYIAAAYLAKPEWWTAVTALVRPQMVWTADYMMIVVATIGTTITPWMQFYLQSSIVDKGITVRHLKYARWDVLVGAFVCDLISFFIIVACAATLFKAGIAVDSAGQAALALAPVAGRHASLLFSLGLFVASMMGAAIVPLSTAYAVSEAFGMENGLNKRFAEAPFFFWLYTLILLFSAAFVLVPGLPLIKLILLSQAVQGILLPVILVFILLLLNNREVMGVHVNSKLSNAVAVVTVAGIVLACLSLLVLTVLGKA